MPGEVMSKGYAMNKRKPCAEWDKRDQRYYMEGEKQRIEQRNDK